MGRGFYPGLFIRRETDLILHLHEDTNLIPWPNFVGQCFKKRKDLAAMFIFAGILVTAGAVGGGLMLSEAMMPLIVSGVVGFYCYGVGLLCDAWVTRPVVGYRMDSSGRVCQDHQKWWVEDALLWPDADKQSHNKKRVLWLDGFSSGRAGYLPTAFNPWLAPLPVGSAPGLMPVTGTRVAAIKAKMRQVARVGRYREPDPKEKFAQGLLVGAIAACLVAVLMAANRATEMLGYAT